MSTNWFVYIERCVCKHDDFISFLLHFSLFFILKSQVDCFFKGISTVLFLFFVLQFIKLMFLVRKLISQSGILAMWEIGDLATSCLVIQGWTA